MKRTNILIVAAAMILAPACKAPPPEETLAGKLGDLMEEVPEPPALDVVAPEAAVTIDRNQFVSVVQVNLDPAESVPEHDASPSAVYAVTDIVLEKNDGESGETITLAGGEAATWNAGRYELVNAGESGAEMVVVARTAERLSAAVEMTEQAEGESPGIPAESQPSALAASDYFRVRQVAVEAGVERRVVCEHPCSVYTLTAASIEVPRYDETVEAMDVFEKRALWFDWQSEFTVNAGEQPVALAVFEVLQ
jgi:hypothetical protein